MKEVWFIKQHIYKMVVSIKSEFSLSKLRGTFQINGVLTRSNLTANTSKPRLDDDLEKDKNKILLMEEILRHLACINYKPL